MPRVSLAALACLMLCACAPKKGVEIELLDMSGDWSPVITVHGFYDNEAAANDVIRGLESVSRTDETVPRQYRVRP